MCYYGAIVFMLWKFLQLHCQEDIFLILLLALEQEVDLRYEIGIFLIRKGKIELSFRLV